MHKSGDDLIAAPRAKDNNVTFTAATLMLKTSFYNRELMLQRAHLVATVKLRRKVFALDVE
jgi:hypothetical protein